MMGKPTQTVILACGSPQTPDQQLGVWHETDLDPLHVGDSCVIWCIRRARNHGTTICRGHVSWLLGNYSLKWATSLSLDKKGEGLGPASTCWSMFC